MKYRLVLWIVVVLLAGSARPLLAASTSRVRSLVGLQAVRVVVEDLNAEMQKTGLRKEHLLALAVEQLSKYGLAVPRSPQRGKVPVVYTRLSSIIGGKGKNAAVSIYLVVQVKQWATLVQGVRVASQDVAVPVPEPLLVTTWENGTMVMMNRADLFFYVRQVLVNLLGDLAQDYREANGLVGPPTAPE